MNKKLYKALPLIVILSVVLVSALLVPYLSNMIFGTVPITSPTTLKLYKDSNGGVSEISNMNEDRLFSKIIHNDADENVLFGVALVFKDTDGEGITITSAGPNGPRTYNIIAYNAKCVDSEGNPAPIDSGCWWQDLTNEGDPGYLHGQCQYPASLATGYYADAVKVTINYVDYYVVLFGATTDETGVDADGIALPGTTIKNLGWGTPSSCTVRSTPLEGTNIEPDAYDTGTIKVDYAINLEPQDYESVIAVITPGQTLEELINGLFA